jgi:putative hydrolase of the HAD superfamily
MPFRAVLFDIGDTLWHSRAAPPPDEFRRMAAERVADWLRMHRYAFDEPGLLARAVWDAMEAAMRRARATDLLEPDYGQVAAEAARALGLELPVQEAAGLLEASYVSGVEGGKAPYPDAAEVLAELRRRGFRLGVVTNRAFGGERFRADLRDAGLDIGWDAESVSVEVGYLKPHPEIFRHALERLRADAMQAVMVGNSLAEDVAGAQAVGMAAAWRRSAPDAEGVVPDFAFDELTGLLAMPGLERLW